MPFAETISRKSTFREPSMPGKTSANNTLTTIRLIGIGAFLVGDIAVLIGQARAEVRLLTDLSTESSFPLRAIGWLISCGLFAFLSWSLGRWILIWRDETFPNQQKLFRQLCACHNVTSDDQSKLLALAEERKVDDPSKLFIDSQLWCDLANAENQGPSDSNVLQPLRQKIMGF